MISDFGSTSFGLLIAFVLPGLVGLYGLSLVVPPIGLLFGGFMTAESTVGVSVLVLLASIAFGLYLTFLRFLLFEKLLCGKHCITNDKYRQLADESRLSAYRAAVDEMYRYHQFWGGMFFASPILYFAWLARPPADSAIDLFPSLLLLLLFEAMTGYAAVFAFRRYVDRANHILATRGSKE